MEITRYGLFILCLCLCAFVRPSAGNAWLMDPPARSAAWNYGIKAPINFEFRTLDCGNEKVKIQADGSRNCGMCGDPITDPVPRPNENGGAYAPITILTRFFESGQTVEISIFNNYPNQLGFYEFRLCENGDNPTQACLDNNLLYIEDSNDTKMPVPGQGLNRIHVQLPVGLTCSHCLLQWRFKKANSAWGCDQSTGWCGLGYGPQKEYYNCADIMIGAVGTPKPDVIQDPTYTSADYGSAYDTVTHGPDHTTTTDNGRVVGTTTRRPIITITPFTTTTGSPVTTPRQDDRLVVVDASDSNNPRIIFSDENNNRNNNNAALLLLLGVLPILGALGQSSKGAVLPGPPVAGPVVPVPPLSQSGFWNPGGLLASQPYLSGFALGNSFGYGNFGSSYGGNYGNKKGYYGNIGNSYGTALGGISTNTKGTYPASSSLSSVQYSQNQNVFGANNNINGQFKQNNLQGMNTWGNNNFVVRSEAFVNNGITRQAINNPGFPSNFGIQGQQSQNPTSWQNQQNKYSNNHVENYQQQLPSPPKKQLPNAGNTIQNWPNNGWNSANNAWSNANNNGANNAKGNRWGTTSKKIDNGLKSTSNVNNNGFNTGFNGFNKKSWDNGGVSGFPQTGFTQSPNQLNPQTAGSQVLSSSTTHIQRSHLGNVQGIGEDTMTQKVPQVHDLYYNLLGGFGYPKSVNQAGGTSMPSLPERPM